MTDIGRLKELEALIDNSGFELRCDNRNVLDLFDGLRLVFPSLLSEIETLRADLRAALAVLQELVNYDNGGSGDGGAILEAAEKILASHKENTDG